MKKICSFALLALLLVNLFAMTSCGFLKQVNGSSGLIFKLNEDGKTCTLVGTQNCMDTDIVIPSHFNGRRVTAIDEFAFAEYKDVKIKNITIPKTVTSVHKNSFSYLYDEKFPEKLQIEQITFKFNYPGVELATKEQYDLITITIFSVPKSTVLVFNNIIAYCDENDTEMQRDPIISGLGWGYKKR